MKWRSPVVTLMGGKRTIKRGNRLWFIVFDFMAFLIVPKTRDTF